MSKVVYDGSICDKCGRRLLIGEGRHLSLTPKEIAGIIRHYNAEHPKLTQAKYCEQAGVSLGIYNRVTKLKFKNPKDCEKVLLAASAIGYEHKDGRWKSV